MRTSKVKRVVCARASHKVATAIKALLIQKKTQREKNTFFVVHQKKYGDVLNWMGRWVGTNAYPLWAP